MTAELRALRDGDLAALADIFVAAFQSSYSELLAPDVLATVARPTVTTWFRQWTTERSTTVALHDGVLAGFVRYGDDPDDDLATHDGYIASLYVHPSAAGHGIGSALLRHAVAELRGRGKSAVSLWVFRDNERAKRLYRYAGFTPEGSEVVDPRWRVPQVKLRYGFSLHKEYRK